MHTVVRTLTILSLALSSAVAIAQQPAGWTLGQGAPPSESSAAQTPSPPTQVAVPATPAPAALPSSQAAGVAEYSPPPPADAPTTRPQPPDYKVWRLIAPAEADWHTESPAAVRGWFRFDTDAHGLGLYVGGSYRLIDGIAFAPFAHVQGTLVEPNLAFTFQTGALWVMPALGSTLDFASTNIVTVDPQVFVAADLKFVYVEGWAQYFIGSPLHALVSDDVHLRAMVLGVISSYLAVGPQAEATVTTKNGPANGWVSAPVGGRANLRIGNHDTVGLFVGYETVAFARGSGDGAAGRFEFAHQW